MSTKKKWLAVIPARKKSSWEGKNLKEVCGKSMISRAIDSAKELWSLDVLVTTDDPWVKQTALDAGVNVEDRCEELANDTATLDQVMYDVAKRYKDYEYFLCLQPTSPLRTSAMIVWAMKHFLEYGLDSLLSVTDERRSMWVPTDGSLPLVKPLVERKKCRQWEDPVYIGNGAIFITKRTLLMRTKRRVGGRTGVYIMAEKDSVDVHDRYDLELAEFLMKKG